MEKKMSLTASEISQIWGAYMNASITSTVLSYFTEKAEDEDIASVVEQAFTLSQSALTKLIRIFEQENKPIPIGFTNEDVNPDAPRLFTDNYFLQYVLQMGMLGMTSCSTAISSQHGKIFINFSQRVCKNLLNFIIKHYLFQNQKGYTAVRLAFLPQKKWTL